MLKVCNVKMVFCYQNCSDLLWDFFCKFLAFSLEFQKFFLITRTIFSHSRSEQFWLQNTISLNELHVNICSQDQVKAEYKFPLISEYIYANTGWQQVAKGISIRHGLTDYPCLRQQTQNFSFFFPFRVPAQLLYTHF